MNYIWGDEIRHVAQFPKTVDSLFLKENCDFYITGSNTWLMSREPDMLLTGSYAELSMMPLSFKEFCQGLEPERQILPAGERFNEYIKLGSFPYVLKYQYDIQEAQEY